VSRLPPTHSRCAPSPLRPCTRRAHQGQGSGIAWAKIWKLRQNYSVDPFRLGSRTRVCGAKPRGESKEHQKAEGCARSEQTLVRRGATCGAGLVPYTYAAGGRADDVYRAVAKGCAATNPIQLQRGEIATRRSKTGEPVFWPAPSALVEVLSSAPLHDAVTLCATSRGRPWTESGFRASWRSVRTRLESEGRIGPGLTLYGLRHTVAVILRESGADERTIADALGQKTIEMARHYAKGADLKRKMRGVVRGFDAEVNRRRTRVVKPV
jgi:hypothetical protein